MARLKNLYYRADRKKKWRAAHRRLGVQVEKCFATKREAVAWLARQGRPLKLATTPETKCHASRHRYITREKTLCGKTKGWRVTAGNQREFARTYRGAVRLACQLHKCSPKDLIKKLPLQSVRQRISAWMPLYHKRYPGDVENILSMACVHSGLLRRYPCLTYFLILLKYGHPRELFVSECDKHGLSHSGRAVSPERMVLKLSAILDQVALQLDGWWQGEDAKIWVRNCGRDTSHILGPVPLLCALGVIVKDKRKKSLRLGLGGQTFRLATSPTEIKKRHKKLKTIVRGSEAWAGVFEEPPRDLFQWLKLMQQFKKSVRSAWSMPFLQDGTRYSYKWVARNLFFMAMRMKGISQLKLEQDVSGRILDACFPDSGGWGRRFAENGAGKLKLRALFHKLKFKEPPEFFSMRTCQLASKALDARPPTDILKKKASLEALMQRYRKKHKQWPAPHELLSVAAEAQVL